MIAMGTTNLLKGSAFLLSHRNHLPALSFSTSRLHRRSPPHPNHTPIQKPQLATASAAPRRALYKCLCTISDSVAVSDPKPPESDQNEGEEEREENRMAKIKEAANTLDIRVGRVLKAWRHEEADSLYVEEVDVGEPEPRIICSGLVKFLPLEKLQDRNVIVFANLKPRNMRGVKSYGMLMAASDESHENVELLVPPEGAVPGDRVWFGSADEKDNIPDAASPNQIQKKKVWELVQPHLKTDDSRNAALGFHFMRTAAGVVVSESLKKARIS